MQGCALTVLLLGCVVVRGVEGAGRGKAEATATKGVGRLWETFQKAQKHHHHHHDKDNDDHYHHQKQQQQQQQQQSHHPHPHHHHSHHPHHQPHHPHHDPHHPHHPQHHHPHHHHHHHHKNQPVSPDDSNTGPRPLLEKRGSGPPEPSERWREQKTALEMLDKFHLVCPAFEQQGAYDADAADAGHRGTMSVYHVLRALFASNADGDTWLSRNELFWFESILEAYHVCA